MTIVNQRVRTTLSYTLIFLFLLSLLWAGLQNDLHTSVSKALALSDLPLFSSEPKHDITEFPDFGHYVQLRTITADELELDHRRLIFVGDIHGMKSSIDTLLSKLSYDSSRDFLVHLGDFVAKGPNSIQVLSQFSDANITGVRGNHEQKVIEWRAWIDWVEGQPGGQKWLEKLEQKYDKAKKAESRKWPIPKGWKFMADHYTIARSMNEEQYSYLKSLPLVIHLPSLHTLVVHAGILPFNPKHSPGNPEQPLGHIPDVSSPSPSTTTRTAQEHALLTDIEQNTVPWVLLNIRSILNNGEVTRRSKDGTPWSDLWSMIMERCRGYHDEHALWGQSDSNWASFELPCMPINVVYGHAAARGLDIKRWSFGLDTGCAKRRELTAMLLSNLNSSIPDADAPVREVPFGESGKAQLVSISCSES